MLKITSSNKYQNMAMSVTSFTYTSIKSKFCPIKNIVNILACFLIFAINICFKTDFKDLPHIIV